MKAGQVVKTFKSKKGNEVVVRYIQRDDLQNFLTFANALAKEDTFVQLHGEELSLAQEKKYLDAALDKLAKGTKIQLVAMVNGVLAASSDVTRGERRKKHVGNIGISVASKFREEGIGTELLRILIDEAQKNGYSLLTLSCFAINDRAIHVYEKLGFKQYGLLPKALSYKGGYEAEVEMYLPL